MAAFVAVVLLVPGRREVARLYAERAVAWDPTAMAERAVAQPCVVLSCVRLSRKALARQAQAAADAGRWIVLEGAGDVLDLPRRRVAAQILETHPRCVAVMDADDLRAVEAVTSDRWPDWLAQRCLEQGVDAAQVASWPDSKREALLEERGVLFD